MQHLDLTNRIYVYIITSSNTTFYKVITTKYEVMIFNSEMFQLLL